MFTIVFFTLMAIVLAAVAAPSAVNRVPVQQRVERRRAWDEDQPPPTIR